MFNFFTKALIKRQLKDVPEEQIEQIMTIVEKNPEFFKEMAMSIQDKMKKGMSQEQAMQTFMAENGEQLKKVLGK